MKFADGVSVIVVFQVRAHDLINRLNQLDKTFSQYFDYIYKASKRDSNYEEISAENMDIDDEAIIPRIPPSYKRQASSGQFWLCHSPVFCKGGI